MEQKKQRSTGLVLSGGGALGFAHLGVIQVLEEAGIVPQHVAGTSMGAIVGALYAAGYTVEEMLGIIEKKKLYRMHRVIRFRFGLFRSGALSHKTLLEVLRQSIPENSFESLQKKYHLCVTDLDSGKYRFVESGGQLAEYVAASAAIPGIFETQLINGVTYVDGGVLNNLPAQAVSGRCDTLIGVNVIPGGAGSEVGKALDVALRTLRLMIHQNSQPGMALCDHIIEPDAGLIYHEFSFDKFREIYQNGYDTAKAYLAAHPEIAAVVR